MFVQAPLSWLCTHAPGPLATWLTGTLTYYGHRVPSTRPLRRVDLSYLVVLLVVLVVLALVEVAVALILTLLVVVLLQVILFEVIVMIIVVILLEVCLEVVVSMTVKPVCGVRGLEVV